MPAAGGQESRRRPEAPPSPGGYIAADCCGHPEEAPPSPARGHADSCGRPEKAPPTVAVAWRSRLRRPVEAPPTAVATARRKRRRCPKEALPPVQDFTPQEALLGQPLAEPSGTMTPPVYPPDADLKGFPSGLRLGCYLRLSRAQ